MAISQAAAIAELQRRGISPSGNITPEAARAELARRGVTIPSDADSSSATKSFGVGAGQGAYDTIRSFLNLAIEGGNKVNSALGGHAPVAPEIPAYDVANKFGVDTSIHPYANLAGNFTGSLLVPGGVYGKTLKFLPEAEGLAKVLPRATAGAISGYTTGEDSDNSGRLKTAGEYAAFAPAGGGLIDLTKSLKYLNPTKTAAKILARRDTNIKEANRLYKPVIDDNKDLPTDGAFINRAFLNRLPRTIKSSVRKAESNPTVETLHKAQSDLGKRLSQLLAKPRKELTSEDWDDIGTIGQLQDQFKSSIIKALEQNGQDNAASQYHDASTFYAQKVAPYVNNRYIIGHDSGQQSAKYMVRGLSGNSKAADNFQNAVGQDNPELEAARLSKVLKKGAVYTSFGLLPFSIPHFAKEFIK